MRKNAKETMMERAKRWVARSSAGETQVSIAKTEKVGEALVSLTLKAYKVLPEAERNKYDKMVQNGRIAEAAVLDLVGCEDRHAVLTRAISLRNDSDRNALVTKRVRGRGRTAVPGKVTAKDVRAARDLIKKEKAGEMSKPKISEEQPPLYVNQLAQRLTTLIQHKLDESTRRGLGGKDTDFTISGLARKMGVHRNIVGSFVHRRRRLTMNYMDRILAAMGLSVLDLIHEAGRESKG